LWTALASDPALRSPVDHQRYQADVCHSATIPDGRSARRLFACSVICAASACGEVVARNHFPDTGGYTDR
jgi:hypothetical protein